MDKHVPEQKLIDFTLGQLNEVEHNWIKTHVDKCTLCYEKMNNWEVILNKDSIHVKSSLDNKEELWNKIRKNNKAQKIPPKLLLKLGSVAVILSLVLVTTNLYISQNNKVSMVDYQEREAKRLISKPDTKQLNIIPLSRSGNINGDIWINSLTKEMLIEINGLANLDNHDYQLWIIYENDNMQGAIIPNENGSSKVYLRGMDIHKFKMIKASVEPKGGSLYPTGPETFFVELKD
ncbi:anti-sigma factor [Fredinandcohnia onubensis]|uniref:anti-sigma factor n=1 Tax=Fredinandcohnia onubensis TaxID=1571209 RepID=UPI000C0BBAA3|nr:anti-sigma factor [Fredinandcohnia onubensis]